MATGSKIEWTDATWQVTAGCKKVSPGCANCYAEKMAKRLQAMAKKKVNAGDGAKGLAPYLHVINRTSGHWNGNVETIPKNLTIPMRWKRPRRIFVNSMSDLFHVDVSFEFIDRVVAVMASCQQHTFQVLTKRPDRMAEYLKGLNPGPWGPMRIREACDEIGSLTDVVTHYGGFPWPLPNVMLGTSVENQATADERIPHLLRCPAAVRFLSMEPLLGPVDLDGIHSSAELYGGFEDRWDSCLSGKIFNPWADGDVSAAKIDWVIVGGESGPGARPMHPDWVRSIRDQCAADRVPFFFKQWGEWTPGENVERGGTLDVATYYDDGWSFDRITERVSQEMHRDDQPDVYRVGKKAAGRLLDGVLHDAFPVIGGAL